MKPGRVIVVTGLPGAGKSTLAHELARRYRVPLLGKDFIKEPLLDVLGAVDAAHSRKLSDASFAKAVSEIGKERGWRPMTRRDFDAQLTSDGALLIGNPEEVAEKITRHSEALGGLSRVTFQMNAASLPHEDLMGAIELIGTRVAPAVRAKLGAVKT